MDWKAEYSVGIHEIDEQHRTLIECISHIEQAAARKEPGTVVQDAMGRLADLVRIHFAVEESLMRIHEYALLEEHADDHRRFTADLGGLQQRALSSDLSDAMIDCLRKWIEGHVPKYDKAYAFHILRQTATRSA